MEAMLLPHLLGLGVSLPLLEGYEIPKEVACEVLNADSSSGTILPNLH